MKRDSLIQELKEQLKFKDFELNSMLEISKGINSNQSVDYLISVYEFILKEQLGLDKFVLFIKQDHWEYLIKSGVKGRDRKSTRLNSSHVRISYAVFCLKKKKKK